MKAKSYLKSLIRINNLIKHREDILADGYDGDGEIKKELQELIEKKIKMVREIESISEHDHYKYSELLYKLYGENKTLKTCAQELDCTYESVRHMHGLALEMFERLYFSQNNT